ncbi:MAG: hypothetical protein U5K56_20885 [Halioglobus sp.]|nr:hypothetical protein [Halioglobus sp.]
MAGVIVCKFGGSSVANAKQIEKVRRIVAADPQRRVVVVSAPGRSQSGEQKLTDHLFNVATEGNYFRDQRIGISADDSKRAVIERFTEILEGLDIPADEVCDALRRDLECELSGDRRIAFLASRGEHYNARVIAEYFRHSGMPAEACLPEDFGLLMTQDSLNAKLLEDAYANMWQLVEGERIAVVPGFYGVAASGEVAAFPAAART